MHAAACRVLGVRPEELSALVLAFVYFFLLLCSYYILRPVRDAFAAGVGAAALQWLFTATFVAMLALVPVFGWLCTRLPRARLLPVVYGFFALNLVAFRFYIESPGHAAAAVFFVWLSIFNLFAVSVFWSFMSDLFRPEQARRLYGAIAAGGSCGAIAGPAVTALAVGPLGVPNLLLVSAVLLVLAMGCIVALARWARAHPRPEDPSPDAALGGSILAGIRSVLGSRYLLAISGYLLCYTALSTALYFEQAEIVNAAVPDREERTRLFAAVDLAVNGLALVVQTLAFARLGEKLGPSWMLALMPLVSVAGFLWLAAAPTLAVLLAFGITRRVGEFAISKPTRETLFTIVPREERYKAKNFIDTVVYRGGDALAGWLFGAVPALALVAAAVAGGWSALAFYLGARMKPWTAQDARRSAPSP
jgi:AAA family ATP:ADP antiporter